MPKSVLSLIKENRGFLIFLSLMLIFRSAVADWNHVPSISMKPNIKVGDRLLVNKMAYDVRVPFTHISLYKMADPVRGEIIIFDSKVSDKRLVKRVIGMPGDKVALVRNKLIINGEAARYEDLGDGEKVEYIDGSVHKVRTVAEHSPAANFAEVTVPDGHYLVLGDNRDNSADSRFIGFVPRDELVGRTSSVVMSFNYDNYYIPRGDRFFQEI